MANTPKTIHAEASLHRKLVLFGVQLEGYLAHFPNCHKYTLTQMDVSRLGHARRTCSLQPLLTHLKEKHHDLFDRLPQKNRQRYHPHTAPA